MMDALRKMIVQDPHHFLLLSRTKQELLVDKMVQRMVSRATLCCCTDPFPLLKRKKMMESQDFQFENRKIFRSSVVQRLSYLLCDQCFVDSFSAEHVHWGVHWAGVSFTGHYGNVCGGWGFHSVGPQLLHQQSGFPTGALLQQQQDGHCGSYSAGTCRLRVTLSPQTETEFLTDGIRFNDLFNNEFLNNEAV